MKSKINKGNLAVQQIGEGSNLGGPTFYPLDNAKIDDNLSSYREFADRYEELNGGIE